MGKKKWRHNVAEVVARLIAALEPDDTVIGGGNVEKLEALPPRCSRRRQCTMPSAADFGCGRRRANRHARVLRADADSA